MNPRDIPGPGDYERFPVTDSRDPRYVPTPASEDEVSEFAAELQFDAFLASQDKFDESMICNGEVEDVYPHLRKALLSVNNKGRWANSGWIHEAVGHLERALKALKKRNTDMLDAEYVDAARAELDADL